MFEIELLELLNQLKRADSKYESKKIQKSIAVIVQDNKEDTQQFIEKEELDDETRNLLTSFLQEEDQDEEPENEMEGDMAKVRLAFDKWLKIFKKNNKQVTDENRKIVEEIVNFYIKNRFYVLKSILEIRDSDEFQSFRNMIENYIILHYTRIIKDYRKSSKFEELNFFDKIKKRNQMKNLYNDFSKGIINPEDVEVITNVN